VPTAKFIISNKAFIEDLWHSSKGKIYAFYRIN
jgi:hypothetical protein